MLPQQIRHRDAALDVVQGASLNFDLRMTAPDGEQSIFTRQPVGEAYAVLSSPRAPAASSRPDCVKRARVGSAARGHVNARQFS